MKSNAAQYQLIPYNWVEEQFQDQMGIPISAGTINNFNKDAFERLETFESWLKEQLIASALVHCDETGINIGGKRRWLHNVSNEWFTFYYPNETRGSEANNEMGILPVYKGIICHDHWKPYFKYGGLHSLCNAHHIRELERAVEQDNQKWAEQMILLLKEINKATNDAGGCLEKATSEHYRKRYRDLLCEAELECPPPEEPVVKKKGKTARSTARNLLERLRDFEEETLRFMEDEIVPFSNNQAENDLRMTKVQQKISGCFRAMEGAKVFCRIRSYLLSSYQNMTLRSDCPEITTAYRRTDSVRMDDAFVTEIREFLGKSLGSSYLPAQPNQHKSKNSQAEGTRRDPPHSYAFGRRRCSYYQERGTYP